MKRSESLNRQLAAYSATSKSIAAFSNWREKLGSWPTYCAATAAALASATSASAGIIHVTAGLPPLQISPTAASASTFQTVHVPGLNRSFSLSLSHSSISGVVTGRARFFGFFASGFPQAGIQVNSHQSILKLASGAVISGSSFAPFGGFAGKVPSSGSTGFLKIGLWQGGSVIGFAGGKLLAGFTTVHGTVSGNPTSYLAPLYDNAWFRFKVKDLNGDGTPDFLQLLDYAYNTIPGAPITAGYTPEPATAGMMLLASGAAGIAAWKRRRKTA